MSFFSSFVLSLLSLILTLDLSTLISRRAHRSQPVIHFLFTLCFVYTSIDRLSSSSPRTQEGAQSIAPACLCGVLYLLTGSLLLLLLLLFFSPRLLLRYTLVIPIIPSRSRVLAILSIIVRSLCSIRPIRRPPSPHSYPAVSPSPSLLF